MREVVRRGQIAPRGSVAFDPAGVRHRLHGALELQAAQARANLGGNAWTDDDWHRAGAEIARTIAAHRRADARRRLAQQQAPARRAITAASRPAVETAPELEASPSPWIPIVARLTRYRPVRATRRALEAGK
jgi:hypothetical protein